MAAAIASGSSSYWPLATLWRKPSTSSSRVAGICMAFAAKLLILTVSSPKPSESAEDSTRALPDVADEFSARPVETPCASETLGPILMNASQFDQFLIGTSAIKLQHPNCLLASNLSRSRGGFSVCIVLCAPALLHRFQMFADHRRDPDSAGLA